LWEAVLKSIWPPRNCYAHAGGGASEEQSALAIECLDSMLADIVDPMADRLGFTRRETGKWSVVLSKHDRTLNPPTAYEAQTPFRE
jgi:hypothetical protein